MARAIETGLPQMRIEESAARRRRRIDSGRQVVVGVNRFRSGEASPIEVLKVDNAAVRAEQLAKLGTAPARARRRGRRGSAGQTLPKRRAEARTCSRAAVEAARAGATVGEMSAALERVFGRHVAEARAPSDVYAREIGADDDAVARVRAMTAEFERNEGRRPKILVAKIGQDGHDRGQKVIASAFSDFGFAVDVGPLFATPEETARAGGRRRRRTSSACRRSPPAT